MREVLHYFRDYVRDVPKGVWVVTTLFTAVLVWANYQRGLQDHVYRHPEIAEPFVLQYLLYLGALGIPYLFCLVLTGRNYFRYPLFLLLLFASPAIFTYRWMPHREWQLTDDRALNSFWNYVLGWPVGLIGVVVCLFVLWAAFYRKESYFGVKFRHLKWKPYLIMLLLMVPLIVFASTQSDFIRMYPRMQEVTNTISHVPRKWPYQLVFELCYGSNFITIELFFRGFLVIAFARYAGKDAILPMCCFYCTIHFGKPFFECVSSYFGGMLLGIVVYHTRSILGGLMVHLGIAWMMEVGGYLGRLSRAEWQSLSPF
jgi:hypothetical protein